MFKFSSKSDVNIEYKCTIRLLDDSEVLQCEFQKDTKGQHLLDNVCKQLNLVERDYFGLRYIDQTKQRHWLDSSRTIFKQVKGITPIIFCFRVKFYPPDPYKLKEEITRYQVFLQLRRDLLHGRLYSSASDSALLAAYIIQSELGDYDVDEHAIGYISDFKLLMKQSPKLEEKISEIHQTQLKGQVPAIAELNFFKKACLLDTYGVDPHPVKDHKGNQLFLGVNHAGCLTFQGNKKTHHFKWGDVQKLNYEGKMFIIHLAFQEKKHTVGFKCPTTAACKHLWRCAVEQRLFFTAISSSDVPNVVTGGSFFSRGSRFRFSGRVEKEVTSDGSAGRREQPQFSRISSRSLSFRHKMNPPLVPELPSPGFEEAFSTHSSGLNHSTPTSETGPFVSFNDDPHFPSTSNPHRMATSSTHPHIQQALPMIGDHPYPMSDPYLSSNVFTPQDSLSPVDEHQEMIGSGTGDNITRSSSEESYDNSYDEGQSKAYANNIGNRPHAEMMSTEVQTDTKGYPPLGPGLNPAAKKNVDKLKYARQLKIVMHYLGLFLLALALSLITFTVFTIVLMELKGSYMGDRVLNIPEVSHLRRNYYEPIRKRVLVKLGLSKDEPGR